MKGVICITICLIAVSAKEIEGDCPKPNAGACDFKAGINNCLSDSECESGMKCCPDVCGKVCKLAATQVHKGHCPVSKPVNTACEYVEGYNCLSDADCKANEKCCDHGCGKICKKAA